MSSNEGTFNKVAGKVQQNTTGLVSDEQKGKGEGREAKGYVQEGLASVGAAANKVGETVKGAFEGVTGKSE